jgi:ribulose-phosphate 3-epimerase
MVEIVPSILASNFARLESEIAKVEEAGISMLHVDVMDGHFVPNLTVGPPVVKSIRKVTRLTLDVHLMIEEPERFIGAFVEAGADQISVHQETCPHLDGTLRMIQAEGAKAGVVLNPSTPVATLTEVLELADYVLLMSVNPGFGGQEFIPASALRKVRQLDRMRKDARSAVCRSRSTEASLSHNVGEVVRAGCDWIVAGLLHLPEVGIRQRGTGQLRQVAA